MDSIKFQEKNRGIKQWDPKIPRFKVPEEASPPPPPSREIPTACSWSAALYASFSVASKPKIKREGNEINHASIRKRGRGFGEGESERQTGTFEKIGVEVGCVLEKPGLAPLKVRPKLAVLRREAAHATVEDADRLGLLRHRKLLLPRLLFLPFSSSPCVRR